MAKQIKNYIDIMVPYYFPEAIVASFVGIGVSGGTINFNVLLAFISLSFIFGGFNTFNSVIDVEIDMISKPYRPLPSGKITTKNALIYAIILYLLALWIAYHLTDQFFIIALISAIITIFYSLPKIKLRKYPLSGNLIGASFIGLLCPLAGWALEPSNPIPTYFLGFTFLFSLSLCITKDLEDVPGDRTYSIKTIPVMFGIKKAIQVAFLLLIFSFVYMIVLIGFNLIEIKFILSLIILLPAFIYSILKINAYLKSQVKNSIYELAIARKTFLMLNGLGILTGLLIGIVALI
jgi:geranylgeranylglycerol-phosphate geranylgeranyltransferase